MERATFIVGLVLGSLLILAVVYLSLTNHDVGVGEAFLVVMGAFLVGLTLWARVQLSIGPEGMTAEFERIKQQVKDMRIVNRTLNEQMDTMVEAVETDREQVTELTRVLQEQQIASPERLDSIERRLLSAPTVDRSLFRLNSELLDPQK